jgi:peptide/nickel transport system substrate-binding protein
MDRRDFLSGTAASRLALGRWPLPASAQARPKDVLIVANEFGPNSLDIHTVGANRPSYGVSWLCYDRLMTYGKRTLPDGRVAYDRNKLEPELAESWQMAPDGMSVTFKLRKNAKFHDGTPVTAKDVKWSFDRAVTVGGFPTFQMAAGSLEKPEQFEVVDEHTFRVKFIRKDKLTMNNLAVVVPCVFNSELVKKNATAQDPWGLAWTRNNVAGGGAYKVESWRPGRRSSTCATTTGRAARCPSCAASCSATCPTPATAARCCSRATSTSPTTCRPRTSRTGQGRQQAQGQQHARSRTRCSTSA